MRRTGIDISSSRCLLVDAELAGRRRQGEPASVRVHRFASLGSADSNQAFTAELRRLIERDQFPARAWVNLWDVRSSHQYLLLPSARASELEAGARHHGAAVLGMQDSEVIVSTRIGAKRGEPDEKSKTEVSFFAASSNEIRRRLRPLFDAGFDIEGVTTPCGALWSQAKLRKPLLPGQVDAHVALGPVQSAVAIFSNGSLLYARDLDWGYAVSHVGAPLARAREDVSRRLALELRRSFLYLKQYWEDDVSQVLLCGDMPDLRSLVVPLIDHLNIEVETLDTLEGFDAASLPNAFAEQASAYRLASSLAAEPPPVNLLPVEVAAYRANRAGQRIFAAGGAAAIVVAAVLYARADLARSEADRQISVLQRQATQLSASPASVITERDLVNRLDEEGLAVARLLEAIADASPPELTVRAVSMTPATGFWNVTIEAFAAGADGPRARATADVFLQGLQRSARAGVPAAIPKMQVAEGSGGLVLTATYRVLR